MSPGEKVNPLADYKINELENSKQRYRLKIEELRKEVKRLRKLTESLDTTIDNLRVEVVDLKQKIHQGR